MGYIKDLRKLVGTRPLIMPGACVLLINNKGELLLQLRADNRCWGLPGGAMEPGEKLEDVAARETFEETSLIVSNLKLFNVFSGPEFYYRYPNGDEVHNVVTVFICREYSGVPKADHSESLDVRFFPLSNLPDSVNPPDLPLIQSFFKHNQG
ncbi:NUDIX hydrolase [Fictibacillus aquaticus]|uniref:ADP-ribose pyrophosphatase n=1 Tax=Fictibacillus aquaticus TaxID=2021314 RepID=A0A235F930_9BACL|nr:NUDIX hydrolase [Fictibacillus aquaticus]OYD57523.1 ADP-ribose pyrophosphatase [Fictibacillus aquaticus]